MPPIEQVIEGRNFAVSSDGRVAVPAPRRVIARHGIGYRIDFWNSGSHVATITVPDYSNALEIANLGATTVEDRTK